MSADTKQIERDLAAWDGIADHRTGSSGDRDTDAWLSEQIRTAGAQLELDEFAFNKRVPGTARVSSADHATDGLVCFDGPLRDSTPIRGMAGSLDSTAEIGVCQFSPGGSEELERSRRSNRHQAIVAVCAAEGIIPGLAVQNAESFRSPFGPSVVQVPSEAAPWLLEAAANAHSIELTAELTAAPDRAANVQTKIAGHAAGLSPLVIMTPKSAWWTCTAERGGGICAWLACLRHFAIHTPRRDVIFTANTGHELSHLGLDHFTDQQPELLTQARAWLHLGANFAACDSQLLWQASDPSWLARGQLRIESLLNTQVRTTAIGQRPLGEARNIFAAQGSFVSLLGNNRWFHHPQDRLATSVDLERTARLCDFVVEVADELANS